MIFFESVFCSNERFRLQEMIGHNKKFVLKAIRIIYIYECEGFRLYV